MRNHILVRLVTLTQPKTAPTVDPMNGDDRNEGSSRHPIRTFREARRRMRGEE